MNVLNGDVECYEFIDEPRHIEGAIGFLYSNEVIIFRVFFSKFHHQMVIGLYGLLHVIKTEVARHHDGTVDREVEVKEILCAVYHKVYTHVTAPHFGGFDGLKVSAVKIEMQSIIALIQSF